MTKEQRIEAIEKELAILKQEQEFKFFPQVGDSYWAFNTFGNVYQLACTADAIKHITLAYETREEAEKARDIAVAKHKLKQIIELKNDGWKPDWETAKQSKYFFLFHEGIIKINYWFKSKYMPHWMHIKDEKTSQWILENYRSLVETVLSE